MYRVKQLFGGSLTLRDYDGQVAEAMALVRALNKMTKAGMPERGCKPEPPKFPSTPLTPCHKGI
ncbi:hypothetical protein LAY13_23130, partial [Escherichia coli]|nr:hypothetical protein [Escherichia coli]